MKQFIDLHRPEDYVNHYSELCCFPFVYFDQSKRTGSGQFQWKGPRCTHTNNFFLPQDLHKKLTGCVGLVN